MPKNQGHRPAPPHNAAAKCSERLMRSAIICYLEWSAGAGVLLMAEKKVVVAGATGLVGSAALRHFGGTGKCEVVAVSRRKARDLHGARYVQIDLTDAAQCARTASELRGVTHLVYAALYEAPNLVDGWRDEAQIRTNDLMLRNLMGVLEPAAPRFGTSPCCKAPK